MKASVTQIFNFVFKRNLPELVLDEQSGNLGLKVKAVLEMDGRTPVIMLSALHEPSGTILEQTEQRLVWQEDRRADNADSVVEITQLLIGKTLRAWSPPTPPPSALTEA